MADPDPKSPFDFLHEADEPTPAAPPPEGEAKDDGLSFFDHLAVNAEVNEGAPVASAVDSAPPFAAEPAADEEPGLFDFGGDPEPASPTDAAPAFDFAPTAEPAANEPASPAASEATMNFVPGNEVDEYGIGPVGGSAPESQSNEPPSPFHFEALAGEKDIPSFAMEPRGSDGTPLFEEEDAGLTESVDDEAAAAAGVAAFAAAALAEQPAAEELPADPEIAETLPTTPPLDADHPQMQTYAKLCGHVRQASQLGAIEAALGWDERCMMPAAGAENRAEQMTLLSGIIHDRLTDPRIGEWLNELADGELSRDRHDDFGATLHHLRRQYDKRTKLPKELVEELAHTAVMGQHVWQEAREKNDFALFAPLLTKMVDLKRQQADALGFPETRYDALLDDFEPGELTSRVTQVLGALRDELVPLVAQVRAGGKSPDLSVLQRKYPIETQRSFGRAAAAKIGFDFDRGRLDVTAHPFCTGLGPNDCRITTRYDEYFFNAGFFGILHEAGHGIYDQGLRSEQYGLPVGEAVSMGIHESQSRMWEILVGRSLPFWRHFYPQAKTAFPAALGDVTLGKFFFAINDVRPSLIRVEADEFTYNLHILIRFELEQALISGDLSVADLPGAWREKYRSYLGIESPTDADGVLQDIHWSAGLFGYFPTYSLGNLYASQFYEQADQDLGGLNRRIAGGEFGLLKKWLTHKIHRQGQRYSAAELCERITGKSLSHEPLMRHLRAKYDLLYAPGSESLDGLDVAVAPTVPSEAVDGDVGVMEAPADFGYGLAPQPETSAAGDFAGGFGRSGGGAGVATPTYKKKKSGGALTAIIMLLGIVIGGVFGTSLGYWILLWLRGPRGDFLKIRDKLPSWIVPAYTEPEEPTSFVPQPRGNSAAAHSGPIGRTLTARVLAAARTVS